MVGYLRGKRILLLLDNCEHLGDGIEWVTEILATAPQVKICATSRVRLNVSGEQIHAIPGMNVPDPDAPEAFTPGDATRYSALKLFAASAQRVRPEFALRRTTSLKWCASANWWKACRWGFCWQRRG